MLKIDEIINNGIDLNNPIDHNRNYNKDELSLLLWYSRGYIDKKSSQNLLYFIRAKDINGNLTKVCPGSWLEAHYGHAIRANYKNLVKALNGEEYDTSLSELTWTKSNLNLQCHGIEQIKGLIESLALAKKNVLMMTKNHHVGQDYPLPLTA